MYADITNITKLTQPIKMIKISKRLLPFADFYIYVNQIATESKEEIKV